MSHFCLASATIKMPFKIVFVLLAVLALHHQVSAAKNVPKITVRQPSRIVKGELSSRIVNGSPAKEGQLPYQVAVRIDRRYLCGGSLIGQKWILTAGHCISGFKTYQVLLGGLTIDNYETTMTSVEALVHPDFDLSLIANDIGIITLPEFVQLSPNIQVVKIAEEEPAVGTNATVSGWGDVDDDVSSKSLNFVVVTTISNDECKRTYGDAIRPEMICTQSLTDIPQGTCLGDSGGPLVVNADDIQNAVQIGIVSFVPENMCSFGFPSGFTRVATYSEWIIENCKFD